MKRITETCFAVLIGVFITIGAISVLLQGVCAVVGFGDASALLADTVQRYANILAGIGGLLSFVYLMIFENGFRKETQKEEFEEE